jgi:dihydrofolate reductase
METKKRQTKFVAYVAASIDGIIAESGTSSNKWVSREDQIFFKKSFSFHDVFVVGSNTYRIAKKSLDKRNTVVFTSKVSKSVKKGSVTFVNPKKENIPKFFSQYKSVSVLGGPRVYGYFAEKGLLHTLYLTIEPFIFTKGVPMFTGSKFKKYKFKLISVKKLNKKGTILLKYGN